MKRVFSYLSHEFVMQLNLNMEVERSPTGSRKHQLTVTKLGDGNYSKTTTFKTANDASPMALDDAFRKVIIAAEEEARTWVDGRGNGKADELVQVAAKLGFRYA